jgi:hypothetical protein
VDVAEEPKVAFQNGRVRFVDGTGRVWTVYDVRRLGGRIRRTALASDTATWRVFVGPDGRRHAYRFEPRTSRELDPSALGRQLNRALWAGAFQPNRKSNRR